MAGGNLIPSYVYVDGFNLYYGAVKGTAYKWLDIQKMVQLILPKNQILKIKYFTALVNARPQDPDQPIRQQMYLRALKTIPNLEIVLGHFLTHPVRLPLVNPTAGQNSYAEVIKTEEKGSDVNIATHLLHDGYQGAYSVAIVISNDSDLVEAIKIVRNELNKGVIVLNPRPNSPSQELKRTATFVKDIRQGVLAASQFPNTMQDKNGTFTKPASW
ncbi:MAG TPA: NYN domain-containing protein [Anaerolineaceae bacterium]|nr:NYN domain-containing protein [Anaerolineaceae bacterium]